MLVVPFSVVSRPDARGYPADVGRAFEHVGEFVGDGRRALPRRLFKGVGIAAQPEERRKAGAGGAVHGELPDGAAFDELMGGEEQVVFSVRFIRRYLQLQLIEAGVGEYAASLIIICRLQLFEGHAHRAVVFLHGCPEVGVGGAAILPRYIAPPRLAGGHERLEVCDGLHVVALCGAGSVSHVILRVGRVRHSAEQGARGGHAVHAPVVGGRALFVVYLLRAHVSVPALNVAYVIGRRTFKFNLYRAVGYVYQSVFTRCGCIARVKSEAVVLVVALILLVGIQFAGEYRPVILSLKMP